MTDSIHINGAELAFERVGSGRTTVLFLHGWTCNRGFWSGQLGRLGESYTAMTLDFRGHGDSEVTEGGYSMEQLTQDVAAFTQALGLGPVVLVGHSMGGMVAQKVCIELPHLIQALVLVTTIASDREDRLISKRIELDADRLGYREAFEKHYQGWLDPRSGAEKDDWVKREMLKTPERVARSLVRSYWRFDETLRLVEIAAPTLVIAAAADASAVPRESELLEKGIPHARLAVIDRSGHFPMIERPEVFDSLLAGFLKDLLRS
jgi:pimeloyl-ACP methyl ester carboxylesterase